MRLSTFLAVGAGLVLAVIFWLALSSSADHYRRPPLFQPPAAAPSR